MGAHGAQRKRPKIAKSEMYESLVTCSKIHKWFQGREGRGRRGGRGVWRGGKGGGYNY